MIYKIKLEGILEQSTSISFVKHNNYALKLKISRWHLVLQRKEKISETITRLSRTSSSIHNNSTAPNRSVNNKSVDTRWPHSRQASPWAPTSLLPWSTPKALPRAPIGFQCPKAAPCTSCTRTSSSEGSSTCWAIRSDTTDFVFPAQ